MPEEGLEPTATCVERILSPSRLPFRHSGFYLNYQRIVFQARRAECTTQFSATPSIDRTIGSYGMDLFQVRPSRWLER